MARNPGKQTISIGPAQTTAYDYQKAATAAQATAAAATPTGSKFDGRGGSEYGGIDKGASGGGGPAGPAGPAATVVRQYIRRELGGWVVTVNVMSDGSEHEADRFRDTGARDAVLTMFRNAGLDEAFTNSLIGVIDGVYAANIAPTEFQIMSSIYGSQAYKTRFSGNEAIRKRIADGKGRPGDRLLNPREYMDLETTYRTILSDADMPTGFYDSPDDFTNLIANGVSAAEFKSRVSTAYDALNNADDYTKQALKDFYQLTDGELVAYLLDPAKAAPILEGRQLRSNEFGLNNRTDLQSMYATSQVAGSASRLGLDPDKGMSEEIVSSGQADKAADAIGDAASVDKDLRRMGKLAGVSLDYKDLVRENLNLSGGAASGRKRKKLASKERAAFDGQSSIDKTSLTRQRDV